MLLCLHIRMPLHSLLSCPPHPKLFNSCAFYAQISNNRCWLPSAEHFIMSGCLVLFHSGCYLVILTAQDFFFFKIYFYFLAVVFVAPHGLSLVAGSGGCSLGTCVGFSSSGLLITVASVFLTDPGLQLHGCSNCSTWAQQWWCMGCRAQGQQLWDTGLIAPWHVGSSQTRNQTGVPCIARQILDHWTTGEAHSRIFNYFYHPLSL